MSDIVERLRIVDYFSDGLMSARDERDADLIDRMRAERKAAADEIERLRRVYSAACTYYAGYVQDEAYSREDCISDEQHEHAKALGDALEAVIRGDLTAALSIPDERGEG